MYEWRTEYIAVYLTIILCAVDIIVKGIVSGSLKRMQKEAGDMGHSEHPLMKSVCKKIDACYQLQMGVPDVAVFVEKCLNHYKIGHLRLSSWQNTANGCTILSMLTSMGGAVYAVLVCENYYAAFVSLFFGVLGNGLVLVTDCLWGLDIKREHLKIDMLDYLENIFKPRLEKETFHQEELREYQRQYFDEVEAVEEMSRHKAKAVSVAPLEFTKEEEDVIRDVIREYMG